MLIILKVSIFHNLWVKFLLNYVQDDIKLSGLTAKYLS